MSPTVTRRYYGELLRAYEGRLFANDHKPDPYYASGVALLTVERWLNSRPAERDLRSYKHQLLMLLRVLIGGQDVPRLNSNKISSYSLNIVDVLRDTKRFEEECKRAAEILRTTLHKVGTRRGERNPPHRLRAFTERLQDELSSGPRRKIVRPHQSGSSYGDVEAGRIIWFDAQRGYGFIDRDDDGDIFVHESQITRIPWHLRTSGKEVKFQIIPNPKSPGMLMASDVTLKSSQKN